MMPRPGLLRPMELMRMCTYSFTSSGFTLALCTRATTALSESSEVHSTCGGQQPESQAAAWLCPGLCVPLPALPALSRRQCSNRVCIVLMPSALLVHGMTASTDGHSRWRKGRVSEHNNSIYADIEVFVLTSNFECQPT